MEMSINKYELDDLKYLADEDIPTRKISVYSYKTRRPKPFIKGPVDLEWISKASHLPGKALNIGLALMYVSGLTNSIEDLKLSPKHLETFNVAGKTAARILNLMEEHGLVEIKRAKGRKHRITII